MENTEIREYLPHRYPFLLVDRVLELTPGESVTAIKNVTNNEPFFNGHFPGQPVMPGVLIVEALAQASGILISSQTENTGQYFYLAGLGETRFKRMVIPGDQLHLQVEVIKEKMNLWKFQGTATVDGEVACSAEFMIKG